MGPAAGSLPCSLDLHAAHAYLAPAAKRGPLMPLLAFAAAFETRAAAFFLTVKFTEQRCAGRVKQKSPPRGGNHIWDGLPNFSLINSTELWKQSFLNQRKLLHRQGLKYVL